MTRPRVFISRAIPSVGIDLLKQHFDVEVWLENKPPQREIVLKKIAGCAGVLTLLSDQVNEEFLQAAGESLKVVSNFAVGYNNIDCSAAAARGVRVGNTPDVLTDATADMAMCLMLAAARHLQAGIDSVRNGGWLSWEPLGYMGIDLKGKTLGIVGAGRIGAALAQRCYGGWGMNVQYTSRSEKPSWNDQFAARRCEFQELLETSDVVSVHCDLNPSTVRLFNEQAFSQMKSGAVFVNTSRGGVVDQDALVTALQNGKLLAAGLDVTDPEPLSPSHPLVGLPNCVIAPHIGSATHEARNAMSRIAAENILLAIQDKAMTAEVFPNK